LGAVLTFSDITQEIQQNAMVKRQSRYLDLILQSTPIILYAIDREGIFTYSKGSGLKPLGLKDGQVIGESVYDVYKGNDNILDNINKCLKDGTKTSYQTQIGELSYISYIVPTYNLNAQIDGVMGLAYDVTENENNKKALVLQARQAQIGEMLSVIAHQWRQPLTAINANLVQMRLLLELKKNDFERFVDLIQKSEDTITHLSKTINYFRDFFKPDEQKEEIEFMQIIEFVMDLMKDAMTTHNIDLVVDQPINKLQLYSYPHDMIQVFINLFANVVDVVKEKKLGRATIHIKGYHEGDAVVIEFEDNVGGIPAESLDQIFTPYYTTKGNLQGTGLGLYMCKSIIEEKCQGSMTAFNRSKGAVFSIRLPV
jgi:PAS domain S-box-containing protein